MTPTSMHAIKTRAGDSWTVTPIQSALGRRIGFRHHWWHWATVLTFVFMIGIVQGIKIGRRPRRSAR